MFHFPLHSITPQTVLIQCSFSCTAATVEQRKFITGINHSVIFCKTQAFTRLGKLHLYAADFILPRRFASAEN